MPKTKGRGRGKGRGVTNSVNTRRVTRNNPSNEQQILSINVDNAHRETHVSSNADHQIVPVTIPSNSPALLIPAFADTASTEVSSASSSGSLRSSTGSETTKKMFVAPHKAIDIVPLFKGYGDCVKIFIKKCRAAYGTVAEESKPFMLQLIRSRCVGEANEYLGESDYESLESLLSELNETYKVRDDYNTLITELTGTRQKKNESVHEYGARIKKLLDRLISTIKDTYAVEASVGMIQGTRDNALGSFIRGLASSEVRQETKNAKPKTLNEATAIAKIAELDEKLQKGPSIEQSDPPASSAYANPANIFYVENEKRSYPDQRECYGCHEIGHIRRFCPQNPRRHSNQNNRPENFTARDSQHYNRGANYKHRPTFGRENYRVNPYAKENRSRNGWYGHSGQHTQNNHNDNGHYEALNNYRNNSWNSDKNAENKDNLYNNVTLVDRPKQKDNKHNEQPLNFQGAQAAGANSSNAKNQRQSAYAFTSKPKE